MFQRDRFTCKYIFIVNVVVDLWKFLSIFCKDMCNALAVWWLYYSFWFALIHEQTVNLWQSASNERKKTPLTAKRTESCLTGVLLFNYLTLEGHWGSSWAEAVMINNIIDSKYRKINTDQMNVKRSLCAFKQVHIDSHYWINVGYSVQSCSPTMIFFKLTFDYLRTNRTCKYGNGRVTKLTWGLLSLLFFFFLHKNAGTWNKKIKD